MPLSRHEDLDLDKLIPPTFITAPSNQSNMSLDDDVESDERPPYLHVRLPYSSLTRKKKHAARVQWT